MRFPFSRRRRAALLAAAIVTGAGASAIVCAPVSGAAAQASAYPRIRPAIPKCGPSGLGVWLGIDRSQGLVGTEYYPLEFTNISQHACYLYGYPGVSALSRSGRQLGSPASWQRSRFAGHGGLPGEHGRYRVVTLAPGATAHTVLAYQDSVLDYPGCHPVSTATELAVIPPDRWHADHAAYTLASCSHRGPRYLDVTEPIQPGA